MLQNAKEWYRAHEERMERKAHFAQTGCLIFGVFIGTFLYVLVRALVKAVFN